MWVARLISILALTVALLLPAPLFRDCCCSRRSEATRVSESKLRPCCQARLAARKSTPAKRVSSRTTVPSLSATQLTVPVCQCQPIVAVAAIVSHQDQTVQQDFNTEIVDWIPWTNSFDHSRSDFSNAGDSLRHSGPPLRKTLCRWMI